MLIDRKLLQNIQIRISTLLIGLAGSPTITVHP